MKNYIFSILLIMTSNLYAHNRKDLEKALFEAVLNNQTSLLTLCINAGADAAAKDEMGLTALHHTSIKNFLMIADMLIKSHAPLNAHDGNEWTPLHHAAYNGHAALVELLIRASAQTKLKNKDGNTALDLALKQLRLIKEKEAGLEQAILALNKSDRYFYYLVDQVKSLEILMKPIAIVAITVLGISWGFLIYVG